MSLEQLEFIDKQLSSLRFHMASAIVTCELNNLKPSRAYMHKLADAQDAIKAEIESKRKAGH